MDDVFAYAKLLEEHYRAIKRENSALEYKLSQAKILIDTLQRIYNDDLRRHREQTIHLIERIKELEKNEK